VGASDRVITKEVASSRSDLDRLVDRKVREITRLAYDNNPFLHGLFESAGMNPHSDISGRSDLMRAYKKGVKTTGLDAEKCYAGYASQQQVIEIWSSGTSGKSKRILLSPDSLRRLERVTRPMFLAQGFKDGDRLLRFQAPPPYMTSALSFLAVLQENPKLRTLMFRVPNMPKGITNEEKERLARSYIDMIYEFNPDHIHGGVFAVLNLARFLTYYGLDKEKLSVKSVTFSSDPTTQEERKRIGELWNSEPYDQYASAETGIVSYECTAHSGMHVNERELYLTSVDPGSAEEVGVGEQGEDLCTCLYEEGELPATFFINYSHGDKLSMLGDTCPCGNVLRLSSHPTRELRKKPISGFGFDIREREPILRRAVRRMRSSSR
jgi:phenylacetate-CoA ligase